MFQIFKEKSQARLIGSIFVCIMCVGAVSWNCEAPTKSIEIKGEQQQSTSEHHDSGNEPVAKTDTKSIEKLTPETPKEKEPPKPLDLTERLKKGEVRAGVIKDTKAFIGGPNAKEKVGDFKIYNDKVSFTIAGLRRTNGYMSFGGKIVAADIIRPVGEPGQSLFQEFVLAFQHRMMKPSEIEVVNDGSNGKAAVIRIKGKDQELRLLLSYIKAVSEKIANDTGPLNAELSYEIRLEPNSEVLEIRTTIKNLQSELLEIAFSEVALFMGDGLTNFFPKKGFPSKAPSGLWPYHGFASKQVGYVVFPKKGEDFQVFFKYKTAVVGLQDTFELDAKESKVITWFVGVGRDLAAAQAAYRHSLKDYTFGSLHGQVLDKGTKKPVSGVEIHIEQKNGSKVDYIGQAVSQKDGSYHIELPPGTYQLRTQVSRRRGPSLEVNVASNNDKKVDLDALSTGTLSLSIMSEDKKPLPVKVSIYLLDKDPDPIPSHYGLPGLDGNAVSISFPHTGKGHVTLVDGNYKVVVSRGFFYELFEKEVEIKSGSENKLDVVLKQLIKTSAFISGDFHVHGKNSLNSQDSHLLKVSAMAGEGLSLAVSTDHEFVTDFQPTIEKMKVNQWIRALVGEEITTYYGHFNAFPILADPIKINGGAFEWYSFKAPAMFDLVAKEAPNGIMQINHPRGLAAASAYFTRISYDRDTGKAGRRADEWSTKFHAIEVVNGNGFSKSRKDVMLDWFSMLNRGLRVAATGNSDSHSTKKNPVGYPRNMVQVGSDDPQTLKISALVSTIKAQKVVVSGGAMIWFSASSDGDAQKAVGLGEMVSLTTKKVHLHIKVSAAERIDISNLEVIANGKTIVKKKLSLVPGETTRYKEVLTFEPTKDTWYVILVSGNKGLGASAPGSKPFAFTNPIYVDVDGDKSFAPPVKMTP